MKRIIIVITVFLIMASCGAKTEVEVEEKKETTEEGHSEEDTNVVSLTEEQIRTAGIEFAFIELKNLKTSIRANGTLKVPNQNKALVTSVNSGVFENIAGATGQLRSQRPGHRKHC